MTKKKEQIRFYFGSPREINEEESRFEINPTAGDGIPLLKKVVAKFFPPMKLRGIIVRKDILHIERVLDPPDTPRRISAIVEVKLEAMNEKGLAMNQVNNRTDIRGFYHVQMFYFWRKQVWRVNIFEMTSNIAHFNREEWFAGLRHLEIDTTQPLPADAFPKPSTGRSRKRAVA